MSRFKGTKGPWEFIDVSESARHKFAPACIIRGSGRQVARFSWGESSPYFPSEEESKSNARLIAAAPDLLEALQRLVKAVNYGTGDELFDAEELAEVAMEKALGQQPL